MGESLLVYILSRRRANYVFFFFSETDRSTPTSKFDVCFIWQKAYRYGLLASDSTILAKCVILIPMPDDVTLPRGDYNPLFA